MLSLTMLFLQSENLFGMQETLEQPKNMLTIINGGTIPFTISIDKNRYEIKKYESVESPYSENTMLEIIVREGKTSFTAAEAIGLKKDDKIPTKITLNLALTPDQTSSALILNAKYSTN